MIAQRTQSDNNRCINNINNQSAELISDNKIMKEEKKLFAHKILK